MQGNSSTLYVDFVAQPPIPPPHHHQPPLVPPTLHHDNFPPTTTNQETHSLSLSDDDKPSFSDKCKKPTTSPWHRVKWTHAMVRLLITAVSYITEEAGPETWPRKKLAHLHKKGKWRSVSTALAERGHLVSPQQCEDKFNDLNKRYKRLNEILGRGTSCEVVEDPTLLDVMDHVPDRAKDEVRKILSSKHLHYEEMCSYHNANRLHLPPDPDLQHSLRLALSKRRFDDEIDEFDEFEENPINPCKRVKQCSTHEKFSIKNSPGRFDCDEGNKLQLEEQRLHIEAQRFELEEEKLKWQRFCRKKDRELEMMRMEIERMRLENERMALDLRRKEMGFDE